MTKKANTTTKIDPETAIRVWMMLNKIKVRDIALSSQKTSGAVTRFLQGDFKSPSIADSFKKSGCPGEYFNGHRVKQA